MAENHPANALFRSWFDLRVKMMRQPTLYMLSCKSCGAYLSKPVRRISTYLQLNEHTEICEDGIGISTGWFLASTAELRKSFRKEAGKRFDSSGAYAHLDDLAETVGYVKPRHKLIGCCGINGHDGPNRSCTCGAIIGTEFSECFQTPRFVVDENKTEWLRLNEEDVE